MTTKQYRRLHTPSTSEGVYITFNYKEVDDEESNHEGYMYEDNEEKETNPEIQARMKAWDDGDWCYVGIRAVASIQVVDSAGQSTLYEIESAGLWGIESDCGVSYKLEVFEDQIAEMKAMLALLATGKNIRYAYGNAT